MLHVIGLVVAEYESDISSALKAIERNKNIVTQVRDKIEIVFAKAQAALEMPPNIDPPVLKKVLRGVSPNHIFL
jgi:hypothetical protein